MLAANYNRILTHFLLAAVLLLGLYGNTVRAEDHGQVVMITHASSSAEAISLLEIRRLYLGFPSQDADIGKPIINRSDRQLFEDFLKNIMHVTEDGYRRKIVRRVFRYGSDYVTELQSIEKIAQYLVENPNDVVFVHGKNLQRYGDVKILVRLW